MQHPLPFNPVILKRLAALNSKGRLAHAYLFSGPSGIGKVATAMGLAKLVNCEAPIDGTFCDSCSSCIKINTGNHPDVLVIAHEDGESIKIEEMRELMNQDKLRSFMGGKKVFIVKNIETLTLDGANAFLKTLEEPGGETLILLTTEAPETVLGTIRSRCHMIPFPSMSDRELAGNFKRHAQAQVFAYFAQGSLAAAKRLEEGDFIGWKNDLIDQFILMRPQNDQVKELLADKEEAKKFLNVLLSWIRDAMLCKANVRDERLVHADRLRELNAFTAKFTFEELKTLNESVVKMGKLLSDNLNIKLPLLIIGEQLWRR